MYSGDLQEADGGGRGVRGSDGAPHPADRCEPRAGEHAGERGERRHLMWVVRVRHLMWVVRVRHLMWVVMARHLMWVVMVRHLMWVLRVGGGDGELRPWHYIYEGERGRWGSPTTVLHL